ncbi:alpha/beta hydrolase fold domain-containing protein, partial [bacterium]|nr:alpha/beta hydrolase fold domain-containing protein [bacterium]
ISAYLDLDHTGDSVKTRAAVDPVNLPGWLPVYADNYLCGADPRQPLASPLYADPAGLPPLLIQVGDYELIRDDSTRFAAKAKAAGVEVTLEVWPEMIHVWHIRQPEFPEARAALDHIARFMRGF